MKQFGRERCGDKESVVSTKMAEKIDSNETGFWQRWD